MTSNVPFCCIACQNQNAELEAVDEKILENYKQLLGTRDNDQVIANSSMRFCGMCRMKLIDIDNFKTICLKTVEWLRSLMNFETVEAEEDEERLEEEEQEAEYLEDVTEIKCEYEEDEMYDTVTPEPVILGKRQSRAPKKFSPGEVSPPPSPRSDEKRKRGRPRKTDEGFVATKRRKVVESPAEHEDDNEEVDSKENLTLTQAISNVTMPKMKKIMRYGEFRRQILQKIYPKQGKRKESLIISGKLDNFCQVCDAHVKPYRKHLLQVHYTQAGNKFTCKTCSKKVTGMYQVVKHFDDHRFFTESQKCPACDETFDSMVAYKAHISVHDRQIAFACPECPASYTQSNTLNYHLITVHLKKFVCHHCMQVFEDEADYLKHRKEETKRIKADEKVKKLKEEAKTEDEEDDDEVSVKTEPEVEKASPGAILCTHCNVEIYDYTHHVVNFHATQTDDNRLECKDCLVIVASKYSFVAHFRNFHRRFEAPRQCPYCTETFLVCGDYDRHIITHKDADHGRLFICAHCDKSYVHKQMLRFHIINHHSSQRCCPFCSHVFEASEYKAHVAQERAKRKKQDYVCDICGFTTKHRRYLRNHVIRLHSVNNVTCDECGRVCKTPLNLKDHKLNVHREKKALCTICGGKFRNQSFLKTHIELSHSAQTVPCEECGKEVHPSQMKRHIFFKHSTVRPFQCKQCQMDFKNKSGLQKHLHSHTNTRPFNCQMCNQGYYNRDLLQKHYGQAHGISYSAEQIKHLSRRMPSSLEKSMLD